MPESLSSNINIMIPPPCLSSVDHPTQLSQTTTSTASARPPPHQNPYPQLHHSHSYGRILLAPTCYENRRFGTSCRQDRTTMFGDRDSQEGSSARKRIAVACGRCRKRKIRCSGDSGLGEPCTNCRNAGYEPCQFLRVSSTETLMRLDSSYAYNSESSRTTPVLSSNPDSVPSYSEPMALSTNDTAQMRSGLPYTYGGRSYYAGAHTIGQYPDEPAVDYQLYPQAGYQHLSEPTYMIGYRMGQNLASSRATGGMFVEPPSGFDYSSPNGSSLVHRSSSSADSSLSFPSMPSSLSGSLSGSDRLLRSPHHHHLVGSASRPYRDDSIPYVKRPSPPSDSSPDSAGDGSGNYTSSDALAGYANHMPRPGDFHVDSLLSGQPDMTYRYYDTTRRPGADSTPPSMGMGSSQAYLTAPAQNGSSYLIDVDGGPAGERIGDDGKTMSRFRS